MELIFTPDDSGMIRATGYATIPYSSDSEDETVVETTEDALATIFEDAKSAGESLDGADELIDAAVEDPLAYRDYLVLEDDEIIFDPGHTREDK
jgi:hypothetical protein